MTRRLVLVNSAWLLADKLVRLGVGLVVWVWLARHFGPEGFGLWNYAIAFTALFGTLANLGMDGVVVRELVRDGAQTGSLLGTALGLRLASSSLAALLAIGSLLVMRPNEWLPLLLVAANAIVLVFQSSQIVDLYFQSRMRTRPAVLAINAAFLLTTISRLWLLSIEAPLSWFAATLLLEAILAATLLALAYRVASDERQPWRFDGAVAKQLLLQSWPLLLSGMAVMVYNRLDQVMIASMVGDAAVGQFSAALRVSEVWYFIPMSIMTAAYPAMMARRNEGGQAYEDFVQSLYDAMAWLGIGVSLALSLGAPWIVQLLYGPSYAQAAHILAIQSWAGVTVAMSFVHGRWLLGEGLQAYSLFYTVCGAAVNVALNLTLIPRMGAIGAAWATLATQIGLMPLQLLFPKTRRNFVLMVSTVKAPLRHWPR